MDKIESLMVSSSILLMAGVIVTSLQVSAESLDFHHTVYKENPPLEVPVIEKLQVFFVSRKRQAFIPAACIGDA